MFISTQGFKRMLKRANKNGGLRLARTDEHIIIIGGWWMIRIQRSRIPKKELAAIIELAGCLPEDGERFIVTPNGNQLEMDVRWPDIPQMSLFDENLTVTELSIGRRMGILQNPETLEIVAVDTMITDAVSNQYIDRDNGETEYIGPLTAKGAGVVWVNDMMTLYVVRIETEIYKELIQYLESIEIKRSEEKNRPVNDA